MPALRHPERFVRLCLAARLTAALLLPAVVESQAASVLKKYTTADSGRTNLRPATRRNSHDVRVAVVAWRSGACCQRGHGGFDCVAHNGGLIPVPGRDIMIQAWYQGGASIFDFTDPKKPEDCERWSGDLRQRKRFVGEAHRPMSGICNSSERALASTPRAPLWVRHLPCRAAA